MISDSQRSDNFIQIKKNVLKKMIIENKKNIAEKNYYEDLFFTIKNMMKNKKLNITDDEIKEYIYSDVIIEKKNNDNEVGEYKKELSKKKYLELKEKDEIMKNHLEMINTKINNDEQKKMHENNLKIINNDNNIVKGGKKLIKKNDNKAELFFNRTDIFFNKISKKKDTDRNDIKKLNKYLNELKNIKY
jgi:hypothetical protein